jgi:Tfp pilus assembly protein FimT
MMVVLLMVAMAAAVAMPRIGRQAQRLDAAAIADELQMMLFNARIRAIARGRSKPSISICIKDWSDSQWTSDDQT